MYKIDHRIDFSKNLFEIYPEFSPESSLYLDFEGTGSSEKILSLYWPQNNPSRRFRILWRGYTNNRNLSKENLLKLVSSFKNIDTLKSVVVFSVGDEEPDEKIRFEKLFGNDIFQKTTTWINMHYILKKSPITKKIIRENAWAKFHKDKKRIRNSLENLEYAFGIKRPPNIRSHTNNYLDGKKGLMTILKNEQEYFNSQLNISENKHIINYCKQDVESMLVILKWCYKNYNR